MTTERLSQDVDAPASNPDRAAQAAFILLFGGAVAFFVMRLPAPILVMPLGIVCAWLSRRWRVRNKVIATVLGVVFAALPFALAATIAQNWGFGALGLILVWPMGSMLVGLYLLFTRRSESAG